MDLGMYPSERPIRIMWTTTTDADSCFARTTDHQAVYRARDIAANLACLTRNGGQFRYTRYQVVSVRAVEEEGPWMSAWPGSEALVPMGPIDIKAGAGMSIMEKALVVMDRLDELERSNRLRYLEIERAYPVTLNDVRAYAEGYTFHDLDRGALNDLVRDMGIPEHVIKF